MNSVEIPWRVFVGWTLFGVTAIVLATVLAPTMAGLIPVLGAYVFLYVFRPPAVPKFTDDELQAWLSRG